MKKLVLYIMPVMLAVMIISCNSKKASPDNPGDIVSVVSSDSVRRIIVDVNNIDSMVFIPVEGKPIRMDQADCKPLSDYLYQAVYDTELNKSDIMIKMQAPDYTVVFYYKDRSSDQNDWLMIWKENGRTKFSNEWYYLSENIRSNVYELLDEYAKSEK